MMAKLAGFVFPNYKTYPAMMIHPHYVFVKELGSGDSCSNI